MELGENAHDQRVICLYCQTYAKIHHDYPVNVATFDVETEVPRCDLHAQYTCMYCDRKYHFNGIAWCQTCETFTCLRCGGETLVDKEFLVYDYYYLIGCGGCDTQNRSLDYSEVIAEHPYQTGGMRPEGVLQVWVPLEQEINYQPELKDWGNFKLVKMSIPIQYETVDEIKGHSKEIWDSNADFWKDKTRWKKGDLNHHYIIIPKMLEFMDPDATKVMDIACGEGTFTRKVAAAGYTVTGTDVSKLIDYARETEEIEKQEIEYYKISAHDLRDHFGKDSFDQVTCNMAVMDIDNLPLILENVRYLLKPGGRFVFSITHPVTAWPVVRTVKLPEDSQHNEDKGWLIDNYASEQPMLIHMPDMPSPMLYYPRKLSTYVNSLIAHGFVVTQLSEPIPDEKLIRKYPRDMYRDYDRNPIFMIFQTRLQF